MYCYITNTSTSAIYIYIYLYIYKTLWNFVALQCESKKSLILTPHFHYGEFMFNIVNFVVTFYHNFCNSKIPSAKHSKGRGALYWHVTHYIDRWVKAGSSIMLHSIHLTSKHILDFGRITNIYANNITCTLWIPIPEYLWPFRSMGL